MTWSRRQFLTGVGVLAAVSGTAGRVVAKTLNIKGCVTAWCMTSRYASAVPPVWMLVGK